MVDETGIERGVAAWNWLYGCRPKSPGCAVPPTNHTALAHDPHEHQ